MEPIFPDTEEKSLSGLIEELLEESFAKGNHFAHLNTEQVGKALETWREKFETEETLDPIAALEKPSFDRCVALYCLILMKLDERPNLQSETLSELLHMNDQRTMFITPEERAERTPMPQARTLKPSTPIDAPPPEIEEFTVTNFELPKRKADALPVQPPRNAQALDPLWDINENPPVPPPLKGNSPLPVSTEYVEDDGGTRVFSSRAIEYFQLAEYFKGLKPTFTLNPTMLLKTIGQSLCTALEAECIEKLAPTVPTFWPHRETAIRALLDHGNKKFELHPALRKAIDQWCHAYPTWLPEGAKFPHAVVLSSLRYMMATIQPEKFQPALIETAILVFFFGQDTSAHGFPIKNFLGLTGLEETEMIELLFRMSRIHRLKSRVTGATTEWNEALLATLEEDVTILSNLVSKINFHSQHKRVA